MECGDMVEGIFKKCSFFVFFLGNFPQQFLGDFFPGLKDFSKKSCVTNINLGGAIFPFDECFITL